MLVFVEVVGVKDEAVEEAQRAVLSFVLFAPFEGWLVVHCVSRWFAVSAVGLLLVSVLWARPWVRFQSNHESIVPNASEPFWAFARASGTLSKIHRSLVPENF